MIELLTSAIGHEIIHIRVETTCFNFIYELLYLPLSFHPAAALIKTSNSDRLVNSACDELVAERILNCGSLCPLSRQTGRLRPTTASSLRYYNRRHRRC